MSARFVGLCIVSLVTAAAPAAAQTYDTCGTLVQTGLCLLFQPDGSTSRLVLSPPPGGYVNGDRVRVRGFLETCPNFCNIPSCVARSTLASCASPPACRADFDGSGSLGVQDIFSFLGAYFSGLLGASPPGGDFDQNNSITVNDIFAFLAAYFTGCP